MPTLAANTFTENIEKSLDVYLDAQLRVANGYTIYLPRMPRIGPLPNQWIEINYVQLSATTSWMRTGTTGHSALMEHLVNMNCFEHDDARKPGGLTIYSLTAVADVAKSLFLPGTSVQIQTFDANGVPTGVVGGLRSVAMPEIQPVTRPSEAGITQLNVSATLQYVASVI